MAVIEVQHMTKSYGGRAAVDGVSFSVEEGEIFGVLGRNGAGTTTIVEAILGLRRPDGGRIEVFGLEPSDHRLRHRVGAQLQESRRPDRLQVIEAVELYRSFYPDPVDGDELLERVGLADKRTARYKTLSGGQKQRLSLALALVGRPEIAVLDELTTGLDPQARRDTWELVEQIRAGGVTIVLVTHFMEEAERLGDRLAVIDSGKLVAIDTPAGLVERIGAGQQLRFRPSHPFDDSLLTGLPDVTGLTRHGSQVVVSGNGNMVAAVTGALARNQIVANELRVDQASLDDAFIALTGTSLRDTEETS